MLNSKIEHVIIFGSIINSILFCIILFSIISSISQYCYFVKQIHPKVIYLFTLKLIDIILFKIIIFNNLKLI